MEGEECEYIVGLGSREKFQSMVGVFTSERISLREGVAAVRERVSVEVLEQIPEGEFAQVVGVIRVFSGEQLVGLSAEHLQGLARMKEDNRRFLKDLSLIKFQKIMREVEVGEVEAVVSVLGTRTKIKKFADEAIEKMDEGVFVAIVRDGNISEGDSEYLSSFLSDYEGV
jgi:hypothetical protein